MTCQLLSFAFLFFILSLVSIFLRQRESRSRRLLRMLRCAPNGPTCSSYTPTPNDFHSLNKLEERVLTFQRRYEETASSLQWTFTRKDLATLLAKIEKRLAPAA